jgi:hypothetical protein
MTRIHSESSNAIAIAPDLLPGVTADDRIPHAEERHNGRRSGIANESQPVAREFRLELPVLCGELWRSEKDEVELAAAQREELRRRLGRVRDLDPIGVRQSLAAHDVRRLRGPRGGRQQILPMQLAVRRIPGED